MKSWRELQGPLVDSDGNAPDDEHFLAAMREFRTEGGIQGYWFCNLENRNADGKCWDEWNQEWREDWECGPDVSEIDFSGLNASSTMMQSRRLAY